MFGRKLKFELEESPEDKETRIEKQHQESMRQVIDSCRKAVERSTRMIKDFKLHPRLQKDRLFEVYYDPVDEFPRFLSNFNVGCIQLEPTFNCDLQNMCKEMKILLLTNLELKLAFMTNPTLRDNVIVTEINLQNPFKYQVEYTENVCSTAKICSATSRRIEIQGQYPKTDLPGPTDFVIVIINANGSNQERRKLSGIYRRKLITIDKFATWKILFHNY